MKIGILKEIKNDEYRVAMTPPGVEVMVSHGHEILIESGAGAAIGFDDDLYRTAGATIMSEPGAIFAAAEMIMHVKEILPSEYRFLRRDLIVFTYLHLASDPAQAKALMESGCVAIAYETVQTDTGRLPLLQPMSEVAGRMSVQEGAKFLGMYHGGRGVLLGGVPGVDRGHVLILGAGVVGSNAAKMACGLGADVVLMDNNVDRLRQLADTLPANARTLLSSPTAIREQLRLADLVIGAVLLPGARAPRLITRPMLADMKKGAVLVDVAIDQGGCFETSRPTTHHDPVFVVDGIVHYCVANMPGAVARTSTMALTNATLPYALALADKGWQRATSEDSALRRGLNVCHGTVVNPAVASALRP
jgi:alanine dehydrogenase